MYVEAIGVHYLTILLIFMSPYTKFEKARIIGARALQVSMGAPVIIDVPPTVMDPVDIAMLEFDNDVIPITIKRDTKEN
jgi:DNA-directed RNA polymerase subunit K